MCYDIHLCIHKECFITVPQRVNICTSQEAPAHVFLVLMSYQCQH